MRIPFAVRSCVFLLVGLFGLVGVESPSARGEDITPDEVRTALHRAVRFFRHDVAGDTGGYLWRYSADLSQREGEGQAKPTTAWLQPPGTPSVGEAYLKAYLLTGDEVLREATLETAMALVRGQLVSGGWADRIEFAPEDRTRYAYRVDQNRGKFNRTTFDDDKSQSALRFLMRTDQAFKFQNASVHEACLYALDSLSQSPISQRGVAAAVRGVSKPGRVSRAEG